MSKSLICEKVVNLLYRHDDWINHGASCAVCLSTKIYNLNITIHLYPHYISVTINLLDDRYYYILEPNDYGFKSAILFRAKKCSEYIPRELCSDKLLKYINTL